MKKLVVLIAFLINSLILPLRAQDTLGVFDSVVGGIPDTVYMSTNPAFVFEVKNTGGSAFNDSIQFIFYIDSTASGNLGQFLYSINDGPFTLNAFLGDSVYSNPPINSMFRGGINTVVIWPNKVPSSPNSIIVSDTIRKNVFVMLTSGIKNEVLSSNPVIYPNPAQNSLFIRLNNQSKSSIECVRIWNALGQQFTFVQKGDEIILPPELLPGLYYLELKTSEGPMFSPFVKE